MVPVPALLTQLPVEIAAYERFWGMLEKMVMSKSQFKENNVSDSGVATPPFPPNYPLTSTCGGNTIGYVQNTLLHQLWGNTVDYLKTLNDGHPWVNKCFFSEIPPYACNTVEFIQNTH